MSESTQDRTEQATPKRREESRQKGDVPKSMDVGSAAILISALAGFRMFGSDIGDTMTSFCRQVWAESAYFDISRDTLPNLAGFILETAVSIIAPVLIVVMIAGVFAQVAQSGFYIATKALEPQLSKLNPLSGIKRLFSARSLVESAKGAIKLAIVAVVGYSVLFTNTEAYILLSHRTIHEILAFLLDMIYLLGVKCTLALTLIAAADYGYQKWEHERKLKMSKQDVKDETKQSEGDPKMKGEIRSRQTSIARNRMMSAVPEATVVVTNPTHIAVALQYQPKKNSDAPKVIAKGQRKVAERIKELAAKHSIPIVENKPLARSLFQICEVGMEIPLEHYHTVAEILSVIWSNDKNQQP